MVLKPSLMVASYNISSTFSEPVSTWYLLTRALVSKKYMGIIYFFLLLSLLKWRFLWKKGVLLHQQELFQVRHIPSKYSHIHLIALSQALKVPSVPQVSLKIAGWAHYLIFLI